MLSWSNCFFFYQWLTNFSRLLPIFSETLSPPLNFLFSGFFLPSHVLLFSSIASLSSPYRVATFTFFSHGLLPARILHASHLFYFSSFLFSIFFVLPRLPASSSSSNHCNRIARFGNHQARVNVATSPPTAAPARFAPSPPLLPIFTSARFCPIPLLYIFDWPFVFIVLPRFSVSLSLLPYLPRVLFFATRLIFCWPGSCNFEILFHNFSVWFFTKQSTSVDACFFCIIVFLRVACSWGWVTSFPVPSSFRLSPLSFCHLLFFSRRSFFVFSFPVSHEVPSPSHRSYCRIDFLFFLFCFFCPFLLPIVLCAFVLCASFLYVPRPSFIHLSNPPVFSGPSMLCRILSTGGSFLSLVPSVSFLPALHFSFPLFNAFLSASLSSFLFVPLPVNWWNIASFSVAFFRRLFAYNFLTHCQISHILSDLTARRKARRKKWDERFQANRIFCRFFSHRLYFLKNCSPNPHGYSLNKQIKHLEKASLQSSLIDD